MNKRQLDKVSHDGAALRAMRDRLGLSQSDVARGINCSEIMVRKCEAGVKHASEDLARRWVRFLTERDAAARNEKGTK